MKTILTFIFVFLINFSFAQTKFTVWEEAQKEAVEKNRNILIVLTGSEWCAPCVKMKKNVFDQKTFIDYATENLVIFEVNLEMPMNIDSKNYKDYIYFKEKYKADALPTLILVDKQGTEKMKIDKGVKSLETVLEKIKKFN